MKRRRFGLSLFLLSWTALGQTGSDSEKFMKSMDSSMKEMNLQTAAAPITGGVDHDFAAMMIPHHRGAIDMAKAELAYGKDPVMRRMAQEILADQQSEIELMKRWLNQQPKK